MSLIMSAPAMIGFAHHFRLAGVDRQRMAELAQRVDDRHHARQLFLHRHAGRAGTGRFAADVDDVDAVLDHLLGPLQTRTRATGKRPPSEKESGVTLRMPMTSGRWARLKPKRPHCKVLTHDKKM
jgi:hypothetical protein